MTKKDLNIFKKYFIEYSYGIYSSNDHLNNKIGTRYYHKIHEFKIIIFDDNTVYQLNSDHEVQGIELRTLNDLEIRFKSFTGKLL